MSSSTSETSAIVPGIVITALTGTTPLPFTAHR
jgi:hypothetical protein